MPDTPNESRGKQLTLLIALAVLAIGVAAGLVMLAYLVLRSQSASAFDEAVGRATEGQRFDLVQYELTHLPNRLLAEVSAWFGQPAEDEATVLERWFLDRGDEDRKAVEQVMERQVSEAASTLGLGSALPLFGDVRILWPPVDMDVGETLHVLAISPRDEVRLARTVLLGAEASSADAERIERIVEADGEWSAWVTSIGGVALYPAPVSGSRNHLRTLQVMAHEWVHHYLGFHALGLAYGRGSDMRTLNETAADIVGDELGAVAFEMADYQSPSEPNPEWEAILEATNAMLRELRLEVDALLAAGDIEAAEARMESVRMEVNAMGRNIRVLNQAYLALRGSYGAGDVSVSVWGDRMLAYRERVGSAAAFLEGVRGIGSAGVAEVVLREGVTP